MSFKERIISGENDLSEEQLEKIYIYMCGVINSEIPNEETIEAMAEAEDIIAHPEKYKSYTSVDEMMKDILDEV